MSEQEPSKYNSVMIIDDNQIDLYIIAKMVVRNNFAKNRLEFTDPINALKYLQENQNNSTALPEVIFVDIHMPLMNGFEFMDAYNKLPQTVKGKCKTFIVSSTIDERDINRVSSIKNITGFKQKPISKEFLDSI